MLITEIHLIRYFFFTLFFVTESQLILGKMLLFQDSQDGETVPVSQSTHVSESERVFAHPPRKTKETFREVGKMKGNRKHIISLKLPQII
jgi:hypothetical protein